MPLDLPIARPVALPLFPIVDGACGCYLGAACKRTGKHTAVNWRDVAYGTPVPRPSPGAGFALRTGAHPLGSDVFVVDLDGEAAALAFDAMGPCPDTFTIRTPRAGGGWHLYFAHPGFPVKTSSGELGPKIDVRGDGGIVIGPGSPHVSGGVYEVEGDAPIADAPAWLLEWLRAQRVPTEAQHYPGDVEGSELAYHRRLYTEYLRDEAPARGPDRRGQGDQILFEVVQRGAFDLSLPVDDVLELVAEHYDPRCDPPWGDELEERVHHKARDAKENSSRPRAEPLPEDLAHLANPRAEAPAFTALPEGAPPEEGIGETWGGWDEPIEPPVYLLDGLIPEGKVCTFFAEGGSVKSWAAFALAIAVATGKPWLGRGVKKGRALILDYEDDRYEYQRRMRILRGGVLESLPDLGFKYQAGHLDDVKLWKKLSRMRLTLLIIDTLGSGMPSDADENTTAFASAVKLAGMFTAVGCTVVIVAHANKTGGLRGSSAIRDSSDVAFRFEPVSETDSTKRMRMVCDKPGPQKKPAPVNLELSDAGLKTFEDEAADLGRNADGVADVRAAILLALRDGPLLIADIRARVGGKHSKTDGALKALEELGQIRRSLRRGYVLDSDELRTGRILAAAEYCNGREGALAAEAEVTRADVDALIKARVITRRGSGDVGGFIVHGSGKV